MAQFNSIFTITVVAAAVLSAECFVGIDAAQAGDGENAWGVARSDAEIGDNTPVDTVGTAIVIAGAPIAAGAEVQSDATGKAITKAAGVALGRLMPGEVATAVGDRVEIMLFTN